MSGIFISYRREDASGWAGRLAADLRRTFPGNPVFQDIASIEIGEDFVEAMRRSLNTCAVVIVMIGPRWLDARNEQGQRRLDDPDDWVRLEVNESLQRTGLRVMPVLVGQARMPKAAELPEPLRPLARRNAHEITDKRWDYDVSELVKALRTIGSLTTVPKAAVPADEADSQAGQAQGRDAAGDESGRLEPGTVLRDGADAPEMVVIPADEFTMGSPEGEPGRRDNEGPQHKVAIQRPFAVGKYEVTFDEWDACVAAGGCSHKPEDNGWGRGRQPVINVSWDDAQAYVRWLSKKTGKPYRLLSEAEWEFAARAGTKTPYPWGNEPGSSRANFRKSGSQSSGKQTAPVGSFEPNAFGLYDMIGNVWEWTQDCWNDSYQGAPEHGQPWESGNCGLRVVRGGSWGNDPQDCRSADRDRGGPGDRSIIRGFRLAKTL